MRVILTSQYKNKLDSINELTDNDILHISDVFDSGYIDYALKKGSPKYIVSDNITFFSELKFYGLPLAIDHQTKQIINEIEFEKNIDTINCFNFMINKKEVHRFLCIKFVEWFNLLNFDYTWSAVDQNFDMVDIIAELNLLGSQSPLNKEARSFLLAPIQLEKRFIEFPMQETNHSSISNYGGNVWTWKNGLQNLFLNSAISLITESTRFQKAAVFTEKTLYAMLGLTFPIWVGGYNQANEWKRIGFDTFDDVIDHSYQNYDTLIERCYYAFFLNLELLSNVDKTKELRLIHQDRLFKNRELLLQNHLGKFIDQEVSKYPEDLQSAMPKILNHYNPKPVKPN